jgi:hypothetical protein
MKDEGRQKEEISGFILHPSAFILSNQPALAPCRIGRYTPRPRRFLRPDRLLSRSLRIFLAMGNRAFTMKSEPNSRRLNGLR